MDTALLVLPSPQTYAHVMLSDGASTLESVLTRVELAWPGIPRVLVADRTLQSTLQAMSVRCSDAVWYDRAAGAAGVLRQLAERLPRSVHQLAWVDADAPFIDPALCRFLATLHTGTLSDYTFADGVPIGFGCQIVRRAILSRLAELGESKPVTRDLLFESMSADLHAFDIETEATGRDYAQLRVALTADSMANFALCRKLAAVAVDAEGAVATVTDRDPLRERYPDGEHPLLQALSSDIVAHRTAPYYLYLQVTEAYPHRARYEPWTPGPPRPRHMAPDDLERILDRVTELNAEITVCFGYRGEPARHPALAELVRAVRRRSGVRLLIETTGLDWSDEAVAACRAVFTDSDALIVTIDAHSAALYAELRENRYEAVCDFTRRIGTTLGRGVYAQAMRTRENESELQAFYAYWREQEGVTPLIQKYNDYAGRMEDRTVADLRPLERMPCWHLRRDMVVLVDGTVVRCGQDLDAAATRGNVLRDDIARIWRRGLPDLQAHVTGDYPELCRQCDEYYTFNA